MTDLPALVHDLLRPEAYPESPAQVTLHETHISWLFFTDSHVYKVKKPVDFGFLDFTTLEKRRYYCHREVELNRRLSPDAYLGVVEVRYASGHHAVEGPGETVEYAVQMRRSPAERMMSELLQRGELAVEHVERLADKIAAFHREAETSPEITRLGGRQAVRTNLRENFEQTERYIGATIGRAAYDDIRAFSWAFLDAYDDLLARRERHGCVRDCHGDLHTAQVCIEDGITVLDCIEFNDRFRYSDVANDVAFMAMDLDYYRRADLSHRFIRRYVRQAGDGDLERLLPLFKCYRAYVRGKVTSFLMDDPDLTPCERRQAKGAAGRYFRLAHRYARRHRPRGLFITVGLTGTGKSVTASELARRWSLTYLASDVVRKELAGLASTEHRYEAYGAGLYAPDMSSRTYQELARRAQDLLRRGVSVVLDASFLRREYRRLALEAASSTGVDTWVILCRVSSDIARRRLETRSPEQTVSDGRWEVYLGQLQDYQPAEDVSPERVITLDTSPPREQSMSTLVAELYRRHLRHARDQSAEGQTPG